MIFSLLPSSWTVKKFNPSSAYARDFANAVQQRPELSTTKNKKMNGILIENQDDLNNKESQRMLAMIKMSYFDLPGMLWLSCCVVLL